MLLVGSILLLLPFTMVFEVMLRAGLEACEISMSEVRRTDSITVHSLVKNGAHALIRQLQGDKGADEETRSLADSMLILAEEARQMMLGGGPSAETVALFWDCVLQVVPGDRRAGMILDAKSRHLQMRKTDYGLARRVLPDLITNAWKAGAHRVEVAVRHAEPRHTEAEAPQPGEAALGHGVGRRRRPGDARAGDRTPDQPAHPARAPAALRGCRRGRAARWRRYPGPGPVEVGPVVKAAW